MQSCLGSPLYGRASRKLPARVLLKRLLKVLCEWSCPTMPLFQSCCPWQSRCSPLAQLRQSCAFLMQSSPVSEPVLIIAQRPALDVYT